MTNSSSPPRFRSRGFTLVELMAVVAITSILAVAGVVMFQRHIAASRGSEATAVIQAIRSAEESYQSENHVYLNVSAGATPASFGTAWWPRVPGNYHSAFVGPTSHADFARWQLLAPSVKRTVIFAYLANAGPPDTALPALQTAGNPSPGTPTRDWYLIQAEGDVDNNGIFSRYASNSVSGEIYIENEGQ